MPSRIRIAILTGGKSHERDIALASAKHVAEFLADRFLVTTFDLPEQTDEFISQRGTFDLAIPVFHGRGGEDGTVQGFLETLRMPYLFSGVAAHAIGMNKELAKRMAESAGLKTAPWLVIGKGEPLPDSPPHLPCVVKPLDGGSTQGVTIVRSAGAFGAAVHEALSFSDRILVEDFVEGDEFTVAVLDEGKKSVALPVIQIKSPTGFYDFEAKYGPKPAEKLCPAPIPDELAHRLQNAAVTVHKTIGARHLTRSDFIVGRDGTVWFLEVNTIPGLSVLFPRAVAASGRNFPDVLSRWIEETLNAEQTV